MEIQRQVIGIEEEKVRAKRQRELLITIRQTWQACVNIALFAQTLRIIGQKARHGCHAARADRFGIGKDIPDIVILVGTQLSGIRAEVSVMRESISSFVKA